MKSSLTQTIWPSLPYQNWESTRDTLHLWMQIVGKIKLKLNPFLNQWWEVAFYVTACGITTGRIPYKNFAFEVLFDFIDHKLFIQSSKGSKEIIRLQSMSVAAFYDTFFHSLASLGIIVSINPIPSEISHPIPFKKDITHCSYDQAYVHKWWQILLQSSFLFDEFRSNFRGKSSPVQFFWGSFDLSTTRFSGKKLPDKIDWPKGYSFMRYAENEENFAIGFWPGDERVTYPAFYSYLVPAPKGCKTMHTGPAISYFDTILSECILPYEEVRKAKNPQKEIMDFFTTTYTEYAKLAKWDIKALSGLIPF